MDMITFSIIITKVLGWVGSAVNTIMSNELLLIPFGIAIVGAVYGILKRIFSGGRA